MEDFVISAVDFSHRGTFVKLSTCKLSAACALLIYILHNCMHFSSHKSAPDPLHLRSTLLFYLCGAVGTVHWVRACGTATSRIFPTQRNALCMSALFIREIRGIGRERGRERGNYRIWAYLSFIEYKGPRIVCSPKVIISLLKLVFSWWATSHTRLRGRDR